eukprot:CAMPEP_0204645336 /NCGR_PEP_ID=MMETSP0718-20130828/2549_1 /ASSEMBLY_ACC=CAM_ASM_000674 /TAXON_ID=230516 /ORGANISM="Chaetoceros curvisetus" /LENGTH=73 /DNA_ID=CAMNT_0051667225 /DNA_START=92 /DNA_END=313 /DNA_ORIENTATION=-
MGLVGDFIGTGDIADDIDDDVVDRMNTHMMKSTTTRKCTFYKAVGTAIQDIITAQSAIDAAKELGLGTHIDMS